MHRSWPIQTIAGATQAAVLMLLAGNAGAQYAVSQLPVLTASPPSNIVMMIDDSGSMQSAYVPDQFNQYTGTRRFNAGTFNALAYNPAITYPAPFIITSSGTQQLTSSFTAAPIDGFYPGAGTVNLSSNYQPTSSYQPGQSNQNFANPPSSTDLTAIGATAGSAFYYIYLSTLTNQQGQLCGTASTGDDNCYQIVKVTTSSGPGGTDETGNFANWYSFYRTRHLMIASAAAITMADPILQQARVTWRALSTCQDMTSGNNCKGWDSQVVDNRIRTFDDTPVGSSGLSQRASFYKWLQRVPANQSTPTRTTWSDIGDYFSDRTRGGNGPYGINPNPATGTAPSGEIACARNYNITLTDGQWNSDSGNFFGNADAAPATFPDGITYPPASPTVPIYSNDPNSGTLSDIAFHYWATNLRSDLDPQGTAVSPYYQVTTGVNGAITTADYWNPQNDPATWPHLMQMTIGIGMTSTMNLGGLPWWGNNLATQYTLNATTNAGYTNLWNGTMAWPVINNGTSQGDTGKAYDLWHAAINSRGLAFSAESPADLIGALKTSLNRIKVALTAQSAVAVSATKLSTDTAVYVGSFASSDWHGTLSAYGITSTGIGAAIWQTSNSSFAPVSTRSIFTSKTAGTAATVSKTGIEFSASDSTFSTMWGTVTGANANNLLWLRGDTTQEVQHGGTYRNRTSVLGDIIDSAPTFSWHENFGYAGLPEGMGVSPNYTTFLSTKGNTAGGGYQKKGMVYVGANDGMLHGFDANSGTEVFGYVPHNVIANLPALADPAYAHRFYVDQTPYVGDACVGSGPTSCTWKTVLVGSTGAGGQGVFALDVTHPESMGAGSTASGTLLWDLDGKGAAGTLPTNANGDPDLGYPIGKPMVARLNNGDWSAIFGNGYLSSNGCAVLFIVRLSDGQITRIGTSGAPGATSSCTSASLNNSNGLGPVTLADVNGDMTTDYVYAGDLQGNMWKFDLHTASAVPTGNVAGGQLLFAASPGCLPGAMPSTCQPITSAPALGKALPGMTGTMVYFGTGRMFATGDLGTTTTQSFYAILDQGNGSTVSKGSLVQQTITDNGNNTRSISGNPVVAPGWFADLPVLGERMTFSPLLLDGYVVFATEIPTSNSCTASGTGWIMAVPTTSTSLGTNNNFFQSSLGVAGVQATNGMPEGMSVVYDPTTKTDKLIVGETGGPQILSTKSSHITGRISWHELTR